MPYPPEEKRRRVFGIAPKLIIVASVVMSIAVAAVGVLLRNDFVGSLQEIEMARLEDRADYAGKSIGAIISDAKEISRELAIQRPVNSYAAEVFPQIHDLEPISRPGPLANREDWMPRRPPMPVEPFDLRQDSFAIEHLKKRVVDEMRGSWFVSSISFVSIFDGNRELLRFERNGKRIEVRDELAHWTRIPFEPASLASHPPKNPIYFGPGLRGEEDGNERILVATPLVFPGQRYYGAVVVELDKGAIEAHTVFSDSNTERFHVAHGIDNVFSDVFWNRSNDSIRSSFFTEFAGLSEELTEGNVSGSGIYRGENGSDHAIGFSKVALLNNGTECAVVAYSEDIDNLIEHTAIAPSRAVIVAIIILGIASTIIWWIAARLTTPLRSIASVARSYGETDKELPLPVDALGEAGDLARALHTMRSQVRRRAEQLEAEVEAHKQTSDELAHAMEKANRASEAKSAFLATMSHEIRTPMNGVIGMADLLSHTNLDRDQRELLNTICTSGGNLLAIIDEILDFSKIESGKMEVESEPFNVVHCIEECVELLSSKAEEKGLELIVDVDPQVPCAILGDVSKLRQIIINLIGNSLKFTSKGEIVVAISVLDELSSGLKLQFSVKDTGIGIPKSKQGRLFEAFSQLDSSTTRKFGGTGLGLAISAKLAGLMDGETWVESAVGDGATFFFTIVAPPADFGLPEQVSRYQEQIRGKSALVIDGNKSHGASVVKALRSWDVSSILVLNTDEAMEAMSKGEFDFVIANRMPVVALSALHHDVNLEKWPRIPFFCLMGRGESRTLNRSRYDPSLNILPKPVSRNRLLSALSKSCQPVDGDVLKQTVAVSSSISELLPLRILVADDNVTNLNCATEMLGKLGYSADTVNGGQAALDIIADNKYDVIFMDLRMPGVDGLQAAREIRLMENGRDTRVIAFTANAMKEDREACSNAGMDGFVAKPAVLEDFKNVLLELCSPC